MDTLLIKYKDDNRVYVSDWKLFAEIIEGQTISSATVTCIPTGLTIGSPSIAGSQVSTRISDGTANSIYEICTEITTSGGSIIEGTWSLSVLA